MKYDATDTRKEKKKYFLSLKEKVYNLSYNTKRIPYFFFLEFISQKKKKRCRPQQHLVPISKIFIFFLAGPISYAQPHTHREKKREDIFLVDTLNQKMYEDIYEKFNIC
jgi:hypothetical protein